MAQLRLSETGLSEPGVTAPPEGLCRLRLELSKVKGRAEPGQKCALNQTRECFLGLHVVSGEFSVASLTEWMATLTPNSGAGIWMVPFRGTLATDVRVPLDLLYLDEDCRVLDTVEFFPTFRVSPSTPAAASVLVLPSHSIFASKTAKGDRLVLCSPEEMEWRIEQTDQTEQTAPIPPSISGQGPVLVREDMKRAAGPVLLRDEPQSSAPPAPQMPREMPAEVASEQRIEPQHLSVQPDPPQAPPVQADRPGEPAGKPPKPKRGWLQSLLFPGPSDPRRKSDRLPTAGLTAHFFTGGAPQPHEIRDMSTTGLYVVTTERWYPGTLIRMTLSKPDSGQAPSERSITVHAKSVRWGNDGVGLEFVLEAKRKANRGPASAFEAVDREQFHRFLQRL